MTLLSDCTIYNRLVLEIIADTLSNPILEINIKYYANKQKARSHQLAIFYICLIPKEIKLCNSRL